MFGNSFNHAHKIFGYVIENWILHSSFYPIDGITYCSDDDRRKEVSNQFSVSLQGVMSGCIGALDGWVVKFKQPSCCNGVHHPASFYSCKGLYGIHVCAIIDKKRRILYCLSINWNLLQQGTCCSKRDIS